MMDARAELRKKICQACARYKERRPSDYSNGALVIDSAKEAPAPRQDYGTGHEQDECGP